MVKTIQRKCIEFAQSHFGKIAFKWGRRLFFLGILVYLFNQIAYIGWKKVLESLPSNPWFYIIFIIMYFSLPISELFIYRVSVQFNLRQGFPTFMKKKILNSNVLGYSGEAFLFFWFSKNSEESDVYLLKVIKDNNVISSITSTVLSIILLAFFVYFGEIKLESLVNFDNGLYLWGGIIAFTLLISMLIIFRKWVISLPPRTAWMISGIYFFRMIFIHTLQLIQWKIVLPEIPIYVWFTYMAILIISTRIPLLPDRDLIFISMSIGISKMLGVGEASIAGVLIANNTINRLLNIVFYTFSSYDKKHKNDASATQQDFKQKVKENEDIHLAND